MDTRELNYEYQSWVYEKIKELKEKDNESKSN